MEAQAVGYGCRDIIVRVEDCIVIVEGRVLLELRYRMVAAAALEPRVEVAAYSC